MPGRIVNDAIPLEGIGLDGKKRKKRKEEKKCGKESRHGICWMLSAELQKMNDGYAVI